MNKIKIVNALFDISVQTGLWAPDNFEPETVLTIIEKNGNKIVFNSEYGADIPDLGFVDGDKLILTIGRDETIITGNISLIYASTENEEINIIDINNAVYEGDYFTLLKSYHAFGDWRFTSDYNTLVYSDLSEEPMVYDLYEICMKYAVYKATTSYIKEKDRKEAIDRYAKSMAKMLKEIKEGE